MVADKAADLGAGAEVQIATRMLMRHYASKQKAHIALYAAIQRRIARVCAAAVALRTAQCGDADSQGGRRAEQTYIDPPGPPMPQHPRYSTPKVSPAIALVSPGRRLAGGIFRDKCTCAGFPSSNSPGRQCGDHFQVFRASG